MQVKKKKMGVNNYFQYLNHKFRNQAKKFNYSRKCHGPIQCIRQISLSTNGVKYINSDLPQSFNKKVKPLIKPQCQNKDCRIE